MVSSDGAPETSQWRRTAKLYRRPAGIPWLIALVAVPLLLAAIGYGVGDRARSAANGPTGALPTLASPSSQGAKPNAPTIPPLSLAPVSITRSGNDITLRGDFPDAKAKAELLDAVIASVGSNANVIDTLGIDPDINSLDFSDAGPVFNAAASIQDFSLVVNGDTITLAGTAASTDQADAVEQAAEDAWPNLNLVDKMEISGPITPTGSSSSASAPAPSQAANACAALPSDITALGPITFPTGGSTFTAAAQQTLTQVADKLKACRGAHVAVNGYTDNTGNDAINMSLSANRARAVADFLTARGVAADQLTAKGFGAADPIAGNDTPDGQAKNRRVEIVVS